MTVDSTFFQSLVPCADGTYRRRREDIPNSRNTRRRNGLNPETQLQISIMHWLRLQYPEVANVTFASAGGLVTTLASANLIKQMGYQPGTPDLFLAYPVGIYHGLWVEIKTEQGRASAAQTALIEKLRQQCYRAEIVKGFDAIVMLIEGYLRGKEQ